MIYEYIVSNYKNGDPIYLGELPVESRDSYLRQEMKTNQSKCMLFQSDKGTFYDFSGLLFFHYISKDVMMLLNIKC